MEKMTALALLTDSAARELLVKLANTDAGWILIQEALGTKTETKTETKPKAETDCGVTDREFKVLNGIAQSEYNGGELLDAVWTWSAKEHSGMTGRVFAGLVSSLTAKGLVTSFEDGKDSTIEMTEAGLAVFRARGGKAAWGED